MSEFNGTIRSRTHGSYKVRVTELGFGLGIIADDDRSARRRGFYPIVTTSSSFGMTLGFKSWEERERFNDWMSGFFDRMLDGRGFYGAMTIEVPDYGFTRVAVPGGPLNYGEGVGDTAYTTNVSFTGATDPADPASGAKAADMAYFRLPHNAKKTQARFFYPASQQLSGSQRLDGALFDAPVDGWAVGGGLRTDDDNTDPPPRGLVR